MSKMKKVCSLVLALACVLAMLAGCGGDPSDTTGPASNEAAYRVSVKDILGYPYTEGVIVRFMQGGEQIAMQVVDENGVVEKVLPKGDYTVELVCTSTEQEYYYDAEGLTLSADNTELEVTLSYALSGETEYLYTPTGEYQVYNVNAGCTYVPLTAGERNYFLFVPTVAGTYEFSAVGDVESIGYYGSPFIVQENTLAEVENGAFTVSIRADMIGTNGTGTTVMVLGVDAGSAESCVLTVERIGDPEWNVADEPWTVYQPTVQLAAYTVPAGARIQEFDLTASTDTYNLVYNESDGFYHLDSADGPLVLVRLAENNKYLDSFKAILDRSGVSKYFFDDNGEFIRKESYTECLLEYLEYVDEDYGVYPLTEDLKYIIQQRGDHSGWFDEDSSQYLFVDDNFNKVPGINAEISWLFMCCYMTTG